MHCEDTVDPSATWRESWRALERGKRNSSCIRNHYHILEQKIAAYAEGKVMSIGVSNFNIDLLRELEDLAIVLPHVVQNWFQIQKASI